MQAIIFSSLLFGLLIVQLMPIQVVEAGGELAEDQQPTANYEPSIGGGAHDNLPAHLLGKLFAAKEEKKELKKEVAAAEVAGGPLALFGGGKSDWVKLMFNPVELVKAICTHFKLDFGKFTHQIGRGLIFGLEAALTPLVVTTKIIEKVFVPDGCRLKFVCKMGTHLEFIKEHVLKFSSNFLEGSSHLKAFSDGIVGKDCEVAFARCGNGDHLKLKKEYEELKNEAGSGASNYNGGEPTAEASNKVYQKKAAIKL